MGPHKSATPLMALKHIFGLAATYYSKFGDSYKSCFDYVFCATMLINIGVMCNFIYNCGRPLKSVVKLWNTL